MTLEADDADIHRRPGVLACTPTSILQLRRRWLQGVVFNEMKGVYSQPDAIHNRQIQENLFPDNNYAVDSGGDPQVRVPDQMPLL